MTMHETDSTENQSGCLSVKPLSYVIQFDNNVSLYKSLKLDDLQPPSPPPNNPKTIITLYYRCVVIKQTFIHTQYNNKDDDEMKPYFLTSFAIPIPANATAPAVNAPPTSRAPPRTPRPRRPSKHTHTHTHKQYVFTLTWTYYK